MTDSSDLRNAPAVSLPRSHQMDVRDAASGHLYRIFVQVPDAPAPPGGYPVLYVLDGNATFLMAAQLARNNGNRPGALRPDPLIVVGVGYATNASMDQNARKRDYTPPPATEDGTGDAEVFLDFLQKQLLPMVERAWPVDVSRRTLFGHSLGGLLTVHALITRPGLFTRHAAASPSLWWNGQHEVPLVDAWIAAGAAPSVQLQLRVGSKERARKSTDPLRAAKAAERQMNPLVESLAEKLLALHNPQIVVDSQEIPGADHGGVVLPALIDAIAFAAKRGL
ncbi:alpha/beta hydrolase [Diaphorobacter caeni]|uniref:alpha/beta hydrolase n=1 Tax=Diaphorobacter caeni TaxID=2784387 RepID=UPI0018902C99|nr:alpha/beta hydrolase-fold protein [Diaphorobacter caeni]MBF5005476.1 alpha/beta hydrolase [Diaphorobacter caeni]